QSPELGNDQELAIGIVEIATDHGSIRDVPVDSTAELLLRGAVPTRGAKSGHKVSWSGGDRQWVPAQPVWRGSRRIKSTAQLPVIQALEFTGQGGRANPVQPAPAVGVSRRCKCSARKLFRIQTVSTALGRVASFGERARESLCPKFIPKSVLITERADSPF